MKFCGFAALAAMVFFAGGCVGETDPLTKLPSDGSAVEEPADSGVLDSETEPDVPNVSGRRDAAEPDPDAAPLTPDAELPPDAALPFDAALPEPDMDDHDPDAAPLTPDATAILPDNDGDGDPDMSDCNDEDPAIHRNAVEVCDGRDNDCDGDVDEGVKIPFWPDDDEDAFGDRDSVVVMACEAPEGFVNRGGDCNDDDPAIYAFAPELCDGKDNDCNGVIGDRLEDMTEFFRDVDGDGEGNPLDSTFACVRPDGYVPTGTDCDDADRGVNHGATEICNGFDDNCNGQIDEGLATNW